MKRCPECEFLYEDEQDHCEMDGTRLFFTTTLPPLPAGLTPPKSIWGGFTIPLLAALILGTVLAILYRATPRAYSSPAAVQTQPASQSISDANQDSDAPPSDTSQPAVSAGSSTSDDSSRDPFASVKPKERADNPAPPANGKVSAPAPAIHIQAASTSQPTNPVTAESKPATNQTILTNQTTPANQKASAGSSSVSSHPKPPASTVTPPAAQNANKDSKVNSFFKKAGKILKKPFENDDRRRQH
jgi:hypothetical protein